MKRTIKIVLGVIAGLFLLLLILPFAFKGKIEKLIKEEINKQVNATVDYQSFSLSFLRSFPDINMQLNGLTVVGVGQFEQDTLVDLGLFSLDLDIMKAISGEMEIKAILLDQARVKAIVAADSAANWDIAKASDAAEVVDTTTSAPTVIQLQSLIIKNSHITYIDRTMALESVIEGLDVDLSGDMSASQTNLDVKAQIRSLMVSYENVKYLNGVTVDLKSGIGADLDNMIFTFINNDTKLNGLPLEFNGSVAMKEDSYGLDVTFAAKESDFKSFLGLVPAEYLKDLETVKTSGKLALSGFLKGDYVDEDHLPAFNLALSVVDGSLQYPDLPKSINNVQIELKVNNPGGSVDATYTALEKFHFELGANPFDASLFVTTPISNLTFKGGLKGRIDLNSLADAIPMDSIDIKGIIDADVTLDGNYAMVEKEDYESIKASGFIKLSAFSFNSNDLPQGITISQSEMQITPLFISLNSFVSKIGQSDFSLDGKIENYLSYVLKDGVLKGKLNHSSTYINSNEFLTDETSATTPAAQDTAALVIVEVPKNIDFVLTSSIGKLDYDKLVITNAKGKITIRDGKVLMDGLDMNTLGGSLTMTGQYNTQDMTKPFVDFKFIGDNIDLTTTANSFSVIDSMLPIAKNAKGRLSANFSYSSLLANDFSPVLKTVNGGGVIKSKAIELTDTKFQTKLASALNNDKYKTIKAEDIAIKFAITNGNIVVEPFNTKIFGKVATFQGSQNLDQSMKYTLTMPITRAEAASSAGKLGLNIPSTGDDIPVSVNITGTLKEPVVKVDMASVTQQLAKELVKEAAKEVEKVVTKEVEKAVEQAKEKAIEEVTKNPEVKKQTEDVKKKLKGLF